MLSSLRNNAKYFYFLFGLVILSFVLWVPGMDNQQQQAQYLAIIGDEKITVDEFWRSYERVEDLYAEVYKDKYDDAMRDRLKRDVMSSLIESRVLIIAARDAGLKVSDQEINDSIKADPVFQREGRFDSNLYQSLLRANRMSPVMYEDAKRRDLLRDKMRFIYVSAVDLSPSELESMPEEGELRAALMEALLEEKRQSAVISFVNAYKDSIKVQINQELIL